jgi:long-chain acyl-CoA synthetase
VHVGQVARLRAERSPDSPRVEDAHTHLSSGETVAAVRRLAAGLASFGAGPGDAVATIPANCVEMVLTLFAAWRMGAAAPAHAGQRRLGPEPARAGLG